MAEENKATTENQSSESKTFTQEELNHVVQERLGRQAEKYKDYEQLLKFKQEYENSQTQKAQQDLESQRKYEEAKKTYESQINELKGLVNNKDGMIKNLKLDHTLSNELANQNAIVDASLALLKDSAVFTEDGQVVIRSKDANGIENKLPVSEGVKKFLETRPYLAKANAKGGGGTGTGAETPGVSNTTGDLSQLNTQYLQALNMRDTKRANELKAKINATLTSRGVNRYAM